MCSANDVRENREKEATLRSGLVFHSTSDVRWLPFLPVVLGLPDISARCGGGGLNATPFVRLTESFVTAQSRKAQNFTFAKKCRVFPSFTECKVPSCARLSSTEAKQKISSTSYKPTETSCIQRISLTALEPRSPQVPPLRPLKTSRVQ